MTEAVIVATIAAVVGPVAVALIQNRKTGKAADTMANSSQDMLAHIAELKGVISGAVSEFRAALDRHEKKLDEIEAWQVRHNATRHGGRRKKSAA